MKSLTGLASTSQKKLAVEIPRKVAQELATDLANRYIKGEIKELDLSSAISFSTWLPEATKNVYENVNKVLRDVFSSHPKLRGLDQAAITMNHSGGSFTDSILYSPRPLPYKNNKELVEALMKELELKRSINKDLLPVSEKVNLLGLINEVKKHKKGIPFTPKEEAEVHRILNSEVDEIVETLESYKSVADFMKQNFKIKI
jgi:hypothetical protein